MRYWRMFCLAVILILAIGVLPARAATIAGSGDPFTLMFDEYGNGLIDLEDGTGFHTLQGIVAPDPWGLMSLYFPLPSLVVSGDVRVWETPGTSDLSDVLRFTNANGDLNIALEADRMIFYSAIETPPEPGNLADTGWPRVLVPADGGGILEINEQFTWMPGGAGDNIYMGYSEGQITPEPGTLLLLCSGLAISGLAAWRRRK